MSFFKNYLFYLLIFIFQYEYDIIQTLNLYISNFYIQKSGINYCKNMPEHYFKENNLYFDNLSFKKDFFSCYIEMTKHIKPEKIIINSSKGGSAVNAQLLSKHIYDNNIPLEINGNCSSACTILLFQNKTFFNNSLRVFIHRGYMKINDIQIITPIFDGKLFFNNNYYYIYDIYKNNPFEQIQEIPIQDLINRGIIKNGI